MYITEGNIGYIGSKAVAKGAPRGPPKISKSFKVQPITWKLASSLGTAMNPGTTQPPPPKGPPPGYPSHIPIPPSGST